MLRRLLWAPVGALYREPLLTVAFLAAFVAALAPIWRARSLPVPPIAYQLPVHRLGHLVSVENANRLLLSACAFALPLALLLFARRMRRDPWLCLFAFPLVASAAFAEGLLPFCAALPAMLLALTVLDLVLDEPRPAAVAGYAPL